MKKKRILSLLVLAPLMLLGGCSTATTFGLSGNWFSNVSTKIIPADFEETLEYAVSYERSSSSLKGQFIVDYQGGTYSVKFTGGATEDGQKTYVYTTELRMNVQYTLKDKAGTVLEKSTVIEDVVSTRVEFLDTANELKPLKSTYEAHTTIPDATPSTPKATLAACYLKENYIREISYNHEEQKATFNLTYFTADGKKDNTKNNIENKKIKIKCKGLFFDNEQLIPMLRAAELSSSMAIYTIDPITRSLEKLSVKDGPTAVTLTQSVQLAADTEPVERTFNVHEIGIAYGKPNSGGTQTFTIVQRGVPDSNTYRNVCLKYSYPVINSHGTLTYTLTKANFYS